MPKHLVGGVLVMGTVTCEMVGGELYPVGTRGGVSCFWQLPDASHPLEIGGVSVEAKAY